MNFFDVFVIKGFIVVNLNINWIDLHLVKTNEFNLIPFRYLGLGNFLLAAKAINLLSLTQPEFEYHLMERLKICLNSKTLTAFTTNG